MLDVINREPSTVEQFWAVIRTYACYPMTLSTNPGSNFTITVRGHSCCIRFNHASPSLDWGLIPFDLHLLYETGAIYDRQFSRHPLADLLALVLPFMKTATNPSSPQSGIEAAVGKAALIIQSSPQASCFTTAWINWVKYLLSTKSISHLQALEVYSCILKARRHDIRTCLSLMNYLPSVAHSLGTSPSDTFCLSF
jgi:hypothetical protein